MSFILIIPYYVRWHYGQSLRDFAKNWKNFIRFVYNFFSIKTLLFSLFSPWERMQESHGDHASMETIFGDFVVNLLMRCVGLVIRSIFIVLGLAFLCLIVLGGMAFFIVWALMPLVIASALLWGIREVSMYI